MRELEEKGIYINGSADDLQKFVESERFIHYIGMMVPPRPGVMECIANLRYTHFKHGTPREDLLLVHIIQWNCIFWIMASIPIEEKHLMENFMGQCGLSVRNGTPTSVTDGREVGFPVYGKNVFTFFNIPGHPVHRGDPEIIRLMLEAEIETLERIGGEKYKDDLLN